MVRKWEAMYYLRKIGGLSLVALVAVMPSLAFADAAALLTTQEYVDAKIQAQGQTSGSILSSSSPDDVAPSSKAVYTALQSAVDSIDGLPTGSSNDVLQYTNSAWTATSMDTTPTQSSVKPVTSGGVYNAVNGKVDIAQGSANEGKGLIVNSSGDLALSNILQAVASPTTTITNGAVSSSNDGYVVRSVVVNADGKTINVTRDTVKIPVAAGAPSSSTPTDFAEVWLQ